MRRADSRGGARESGLRTLAAVKPPHVAAYIEGLQLAKPTVKRQPHRLKACRKPIFSASADTDRSRFCAGTCARPTCSRLTADRNYEPRLADKATIAHVGRLLWRLFAVRVCG